MNFKRLSFGTDVAIDQGMKRALPYTAAAGFVLLCLMLSLVSGRRAVAAASAIGEVYTLIRSNRPAEAIFILASFRPGESELSPYHAAYAEALEQTGAYREAVEHYRLAYIYAGSVEMKEDQLFRRCRVYEKAGYHSETALCLGVFLKTFPASQRREQAHLSLADAKMKLHEYADALHNYEQAGTSIRAAYGRANALHAKGMYKDAHEIYFALVSKDKGYINSSDETRLLIGENFRLMKKRADAKIYLNSIQDPMLKQQADLGLGMIAEDEGKYEDALMHFSAASQSADRVIKKRGILNTAHILLKTGRLQEAEEKLKEIRNSEPYGKEFDEALILLAQVYRNIGRFEDASALLKEGLLRSGPDTAELDELEALLTAALNKDRDVVAKIWKSTGQWLYDPGRTKTLLEIARAMSGKPFLDLCKWLLKYGGPDAKTDAQLLLAEFYARIGDYDAAEGYLSLAKAKRKEDTYIRITARMLMEKGKQKEAAEAIMTLSEPREEDLLLLLSSDESVQNLNAMTGFLKERLAKIPGTVRLYTRAADFFYKTGEHADARRYYEGAASAGPAAGGNDARELEWAGYRLAIMGGKAAVSKNHKGANPAGKMFEADRKADMLMSKVKQVL